jgi:hypothetical protein
MSSTNENDDTLKVFNDLYGDLGDESMGTSEPPQSSERSPTPQLTHMTALNFLRRRVKSKLP